MIPIWEGEKEGIYILDERQLSGLCHSPSDFTLES
jgi:hypothetical protein